MKKMTIEIKVLDNKKHKEVYPDFREFLNCVIESLQKAAFFDDGGSIVESPSLMSDLTLEIDPSLEESPMANELELARLKNSFVEYYGIDITPLVGKIKNGDEITEAERTFSVITAISEITYEEDLENEVLFLPQDEDDEDGDFYDG